MTGEQFFKPVILGLDTANPSITVLENSAWIPGFGIRISHPYSVVLTFRRIWCSLVATRSALIAVPRGCSAEHVKIYFQKMTTFFISPISTTDFRFFSHVYPVAALAMGLRGSSPPPDFAQASPDFCIKWCFVSISKWQLSLSAITEGLHLTVKCKK